MNKFSGGRNWAEGHSVATIAQRMCTTKSAVIGKAKRLGLEKHSSVRVPQYASYIVKLPSLN